MEKIFNLALLALLASASAYAESSDEWSVLTCSQKDGRPEAPSYRVTQYALKDPDRENKFVKKYILKLIRNVPPSARVRAPQWTIDEQSVKDKDGQFSVQYNGCKFGGMATLIVEKDGTSVIDIALSPLLNSRFGNFQVQELNTNARITDYTCTQD